MLMGLTILLLMSSMQDVAQSNEPPQPVDKWGLRDDAGKCMLHRTFSAPTPLSFALMTDVGTNEFSMVLMKDKFASTKPGDNFDVTLTMEASDGTKIAPIKKGAWLNKVQGREAAIINFFDESFLDVLGKASAVSFNIPHNDAGPFALPSAKGAVKALRNCEAQQMIEWGADPAQFLPGGKRALPIGNPYEIIGWDTLKRAHPQGEELVTDFRVTIDQQGAVNGCKRVQPAKSAQAETVVCKALTGQKRFQPARAPDGTAVNGAYVIPIRLRIATVTTSEPMMTGR